MKKVICLLMLIMFIPSMVLADSAGPILGYDAIVSNKNGAKCIDDDKIIKYKQKVHVMNEYNDEVDIEICRINIKDIIPSKNELVPTDNDIKKGDLYNASIEKVNEKIIILEKNGVKLSKGPSEVYEKYDYIIPFNQELKVTYAIESYKRGFGKYIWYYVDDGEYKGWIDSSFERKYKFAFFYGQVLVLENTNVFDEEGNVIFYIPAETKIDNLYMITTDGSYYVYYNNQKGYIGKENFYFCNTFNDVNVIASDDIVVKSLFGGSKGTIKKGQTINKICSYVDIVDDAGPGTICINSNCYYYVESNNIKGIIRLEDYNNNIGDDENQIERDTPSEIIKDDITISKKDNNPTMIIIFMVIGTFVLALMTLVIIKLVNKKNKNKIEEKNVKNITDNKNETLKEGITNKIDNPIKKEEPKEEKKIEVEKSNNISTNNSIKKREVTIDKDEREE